MAAKQKSSKIKPQNVVVRTYSAGVHTGTLKSRNGKEVVLTNAKRIWSWQGAKTLSEIAVAGVGTGSRVCWRPRPPPTSSPTPSRWRR